MNTERDKEHFHKYRSYLSIPIKERNENYKVDVAAEIPRRISHSERNAEGNFTADELYKRLKFHSPWIEYTDWSSQKTKINKVLEFLEQFPVGDIHITLPTMPPIGFGIDFERPLSQLDVKDLRMELNAHVHSNGRQAMFDLEDYKE